MPEIVIRALQQADESAWRRLWTAYLEFYETAVPEEVYATTWQRLFADGAFEPRGLLAVLDGQPVGLVHYLYHRSCWSIEGNCYLQDLFSDKAARGKGVGAKLIKAVQDAAAERGVKNVYWMTHQSNVTAQSLYDKVARKTGFIEYDLL